MGKTERVREIQHTQIRAYIWFVAFAPLLSVAMNGIAWFSLFHSFIWCCASALAHTTCM